MSRQTLAAVLAPLAVLAVLAAATGAGIGYARDGASEDPSDPVSSAGPDESDAVPDGFERVTAADVGASYLVPTDDAWTVRSAEDEVGLTEDADTGPVVQGVSAYGEGACADGDEQTPVALAGFVEPRADATAQDTAREVAATWARAATTARGGRDEPTLAPVRLDDGTAAWTAAAVVPDPQGPCPGTPAVEIRTLSLLAGEEVSTFVLARATATDGEDLADSLDAAGADEVLRSVTAD